MKNNKDLTELKPSDIIVSFGNNKMLHSPITKETYDYIYNESRKETLHHVLEIVEDVSKRSINNHEWAFDEIKKELTALADSPQTGANA